ncbi:hypothetical protein AB3N02_24925 [Priestia aryabhattai]|uniref:hypothetical protein n=1 Tax=Priestia aryabhattai TaxID=412384 RepID=UPI00399EEE65
MKPKDLLNFYIKTDLLPLLEPLGFKYAKSVPKFSRKTGSFNLSLSFCISQYSSEDECTFWTMWDVSSNEYGKWYKQIWDTKLANNVVVASADWNIPNWLEGNEEHFTLYNKKSDKEEFSRFVHNVINIGIPYYEQIIDWNTAAELALNEEDVFYDRVCDFYLMANEKKKAKDVLEYGLERATDEDYEDLKERMDKYFN